MFAIAFDLVVRDTEAAQPESVSQAYADINAVLNRYGFARIQGSVYLAQTDSLVGAPWR